LAKAQEPFGLKKDHFLWIKKIFATYLPDVKVHVFGSRARGDHKQYSDLDLALESSQPISRKTWAEVQEQFTNSSIPIKIDMIELSQIDPAFRKGIQEELKEFSTLN
jgi:type I restriction enzyme S subunit